MHITKFTIDKTRLLPILTKKLSSVTQSKAPKSLSNRQLFRQILPPHETLREIEALNLGKPRKRNSSPFKKKVNIIEKKKLERRLGDLTLEQEEHLELPHLSFFAGAKIPTSFPPERVQELCFVGRSNVGKSSLINALADTTVVRTSDKPGLTQQINFYAAGNMFNMVDMPGYGFAYVKDEERLKWKELIEIYISQRKTLKRIFVIVDARHASTPEPPEPKLGLKIADKEFISMLDRKNIEFQIILTKCDMVIAPDLARRHTIVKEQLQVYKNAIPQPMMVSARRKAGIYKLRKLLLTIIGGLERAREVANKKKEHRLADINNKSKTPLHKILKKFTNKKTPRYFYVKRKRERKSLKKE
ncbi:P-loop containing nucleoside triphosphate hydrolase protein [Gigaspora rosea]|uniref:P-loop containing nucleoside triphosphate hydrolase protein n=1 Tax=Gigaspora rosea TaxID=44941 RepID=A0A397U5V2_9GLOM|nr:P-loop containing nucleoside triphosphate hydrolase protein [Gigaspora rosea]CAG8494283.1 18883_t:CDS:2 [Gigaspora rosea]